MSISVVVLDTCVLFDAAVRDTLLRAADAGLYQVCLTSDILEELRRSLIRRRGIPPNKAQRLVDIIGSNFPDLDPPAIYKQLISSMPVNEKDRHVLAAAVACRARTIVTFNLKDFPQGALYRSNIEVDIETPDDFLMHLFYSAPECMHRILLEQAGDLCSPSQTVPQLLNVLQRGAPNFVRLFRARLTGPASPEWPSEALLQPTSYLPTTRRHKKHHAIPEWWSEGISAEATRGYLYHPYD